MAELILVNVSQAPASVMLPTGRPIVILPGFGVSGDYFSKYVEAGVMMPLAHIPSSFVVKGIAEPLKTEGVRTSRDPSTLVGDNKRKPEPTAKPVEKSTLMALAEEGKGTTDGDVAAAHGIDIKSHENLLDGITVAGWTERIRSISDNTLAQQMKLDQLRELAKFLGIDSADLLTTKSDIIQAVRVKCR